MLEILDSLGFYYDSIWRSMIKQTLRRVYPGFNEAYMGYRNFADLLKHAESEGYIEIEYVETRGSHNVRLVDYQSLAASGAGEASSDGSLRPIWNESKKREAISRAASLLGSAAVRR